MDATCIVMEDLKHSGSRMNDKRFALTLDHVLCVVAEATFAALGINAKKRMGTEKFILANASLTSEPFDDIQFITIINNTIYPGSLSFAKSSDIFLPTD